MKKVITLLTTFLSTTQVYAAAEIIQPIAGAPAASSKLSQSPGSLKAQGSTQNCANAESIKDYMAKLNAASKTIPAKTGTDFIVKQAGPDANATLISSLKEEGPYISEDDISLAKAKTEPQALTLHGSRNNKRGGMVVWNNNIYPADFFVQHYDAWNSGKNKKLPALLEDLKKQPWMSWENCSLKFHESGAQRAILDKMKAKAGSTIKVYRGTTDLEALMLDLNQKVSAGKEVGPEWTASLKASLDKLLTHAKDQYESSKKLYKEHYIASSELNAAKAALDRRQKANDEMLKRAAQAKTSAQIQAFAQETFSSLLKQGDFQGLFTTPDLERAKLFSKGKVVSFDLPVDTLEKFLSKDRLYVGFEKISTETHEDPQIELALLASPSPAETAELSKAVMSSYKGSQDAADSTLFN